MRFSGVSIICRIPKSKYRKHIISTVSYIHLSTQHNIMKKKSKKMKRVLHLKAFLLVILLLAGMVSGSIGEERGYMVENNPEKNQQRYPYRVVTNPAVLYLGRDDIDMLGEEAFYAGLDLLMAGMEKDFAEVREVLKDYLKDEIPSIPIYTDFTGRAEEAALADAFYYDPDLGIRLFKGWSDAGYSLLHEYVHYLTDACVTFEISHGFWAEGVAEYLSKLVCSNRMARAFNYAMGDELAASMIARGAADEEGKLDIRKVYYGGAAIYNTPIMVGEKYFAVCNSWMTMTEQQQEHPTMMSVTYHQSACFVEYLVRQFGFDYVLTHMGGTAKEFKENYGREFEELFGEWQAENMKMCERMHMAIY